MSKQIPFRYDFVGSFLRPANLKAAREITEGSMISQGYLSRIFRDQFGISMMEYIRLRKIQMVKINFIFTTHNTSDVAFMLGFIESSYLQKVFQKVEGISIQEFKNRLK